MIRGAKEGGNVLMKKDSEISRMFQYAGNRHWLTILGMILAGLSTVLSRSARNQRVLFETDDGRRQCAFYGRIYDRAGDDE